MAETVGEALERGMVKGIADGRDAVLAPIESCRPAPHARLVVPRRADNGRRDQLWAFCRRYWETSLPEWQIVEGHHEDGPFNRGAALNRAAQGCWDVAVVLDGDVILPPEQVRAAVESAAKTERACFAYDRFAGLKPQMTDEILAGYTGTWERGIHWQTTDHVSSCLAVPRALWDELGGFDERFEGWGHEDRAFHHACRVAGGGVDRIPGTVWHLWHENSPGRPGNLRTRGTGWTPEYAAGKGLVGRYYAANTLPLLRALKAEQEPDAVVLIVVTDGRRDCIAETIPSAEKHLRGLPVTRKVICDDSGDFDYQCWLRLEFPDYELIGDRARLGFGGAVRRAQAIAVASGQPWVFWLEDDFTFNEEIRLDRMAGVLDANPHVVQMALRRQAWVKSELDAGGVVERDPDKYEDHEDGDAWLEHSLFWTTNPHLTRRSTLAEREWPARNGSEAAWSRQMLTGDRRSGYWGARESEPMVTHIGHERAGKGY